MSKNFVKETKVKKVLGILLLASGFGSSALAAVPFPIGTKMSTCMQNTEIAIEKMSELGFYDKDGVATQNCYTADYRTEIICEVKATRENGTVTDFYQVNLNRSCSKVHHIQLTGMGD